MLGKMTLKKKSRSNFLGRNLSFLSKHSLFTKLLAIWFFLLMSIALLLHGWVVSLLARHREYSSCIACASLVVLWLRLLMYRCNKW